MTDARATFQRVDAIVDAALDRDSAERPAFVDAATEGEPAVRAAAHALLRAMRQADAAGDFLAAPIAPDPLQARLQRALDGTYRLRGRIGAGGMARVYLADDLRHGRPVAIKVMATHDIGPDAAAAARFLDEIAVMARLQHPHLLPLFDSGSADGVPYLVMPYVAGETLRDRLTREGPLPVDEAVRLARAIAGALEHAHGAGVVHRDLKPENVLLRDHEPLVADFGIALAVAADARRTRSGMLVGTPQYMAPEQAGGDGPVDARADVYALGAVLYEMLTGDPPHVAGTVQGVLARVRAARPTPARLLRAAVPVPLSDTIDRALATDPADRFPTAAAFSAALTGALALPARPHRARIPLRRVGRAGMAVAACIAAVAVGGGVRAWRGASDASAATAPAEAARFVVAPLREAAIGREPTLTPDGASLVYAGAAESGRQLYVRPVRALAAHALPQTAGALNAVVSPDGRSVAYVTTDDQLVRIPIEGGAPTVLGGVFRYSDLTWAGDDRLVVDSYGQGGLSWIPAAGGAARPLTRLVSGPGTTGPTESGHGSPFALPDGRTVVFMIWHDITGPGTSPGELAVVTLDPARPGAGVHVPLGVHARRAVGWVDGWLLYLSVDGARILAQRLDLDPHDGGTTAPRLRGPAIPVLEHPDGGIDIATLARDGTLLYTRARTVNAPVLVDTAGQATPALGARAGYFMNPRLSPDGRRLSAQVADAGGNDAWVYELATGTAMRLTRVGGSLSPSWTPDGTALVYYSPQGGRDAIWRVAADGRSAPERIAEVRGAFAPSVTPDGREVLFQRTIGGLWGIWTVPLVAGPDGARVPRPIVVGRSSACMPALSPDGRWLAYAANGSGRYEVYVRPYPGPGADVQVSRDGGSEPAWAADGRRLFFRGDRRLYVGEVSTTSAPTLTVREPRVLFVDAFDGDMPMPHRNYDVAHDGRHFVMIGAHPGSAPETVVVLRWLDELRARLARAGGS